MTDHQVHFIFYKTPPRVSVLLRLAPWHQKSNRVLSSRPPRPSSPSLDAVRSSAAACSLVEGGGPMPLGLPGPAGRRDPARLGLPLVASSARQPSSLVDPGAGNKATQPPPQQKHQHLTPVHHLDAAPVHLVDVEQRHHILPASRPHASALAPPASSSSSSTAKFVLASPRPNPVTKNRRHRHPSVASIARTLTCGVLF
jgi:hypothetical protein